MHDLNKIRDATVREGFSASPVAMVPETRMAFTGFAKQQERDDVIAFLDTRR